MASDNQARTPRDLGRDVSALNGIRGLAILQVVLAHTHYLVNSDPQAVYMTNSWFVNRIFEPGYLGLDLFFVLSGFLISSLLLRDLADRSAGSRKRTTVLRYFYARRALRLLPALYVMLALDWVFVLISGDVSLHTQWRTTYSAVFYIANWATVWNLPATNPDLGHLWSLAVEEQFYIVWPLVLLGLTVLVKNRSVKLLAIITAIVIIAARRIDLYQGGANWLFVYIRTDTRIDSMLVGAAFAIIYRYFSIRTAVTSLLASAGLIGIIYYKFASPPSDLFEIGFTRTAVFAGLGVLGAASGGWVFNRVLQWRPLVSLGKYSYGLYLYHHVIFLGIGRHMSQYPQSFRLFLGYGASALCTFLSWRLVESKCLRLKTRFESSHANTG